MKQRILGCLSFSLITHFCLVAAAFVLPGVSNDGTNKATAPTVSATTVITDSSAAPAESNDIPVEIVKAAAQPVTTPEEKPQVIAANDPMPVKDTDVVAPILPAKKSVKSSEPKLTTSLPEKHSKMIKDTADDADEKLKQALSESRHNTASRPEIASDIIVPVVAQNNMPQQLQPDATFPEESSASVTTAPAVRQAPVAAAPVAQSQPQAQPAQQAQVARPQGIAPISKSAQVGSSALTQNVVRNGDDLKEVAGNTRPVYPLADRRAGHQGTVIFLARLTPDGQVMNIRIEKSSSSPSLDSAAYTAFRTYRYQNGQQGMIRKAFTFTLKGDAVEAPVATR